MKFVFILCSLISFSAFSFEAKMDSLRTRQTEVGLFVIHEVEQEETLFSLSQRYNSSVSSIVDLNELDGNAISIGQILTILFNEKDQVAPQDSLDVENAHLILKGETLYSISRLYDIKVKDLKKLNNLVGNEISPGEYLKFREPVQSLLDTLDTPMVQLVDTLVHVDTVTSAVVDESAVPDGFSPYLVQTGETLLSIARKEGVELQMLKEWNNLTSDYLRIGQKLIIKDTIEFESTTDSLEFYTRLDDDGFEREFKIGIAAVISDISTSKYLALHRELPLGTELKVRNLMNNQVVHVKVIGRLPDTGINRNVLLRLSQPVFDQLGILDPKSRVEVSHFKK